MLYEFALDPRVLSSWQSFRYFMSGFGVHRGRMISRYPKRWKRMVYDASLACGEIERKKIEEGLTGVDPKLLPTTRTYNGELLWLENAEAQQRIEPFHAIISNSNPNEVPEVLIADEVTETTPLWDVQRERRVPRRAEDLADCISLLCRQSSKVLFADPNFSPALPRFRTTLERFINAAISANPSIRQIEYHLRVDADSATREWFEAEAIRHFGRILPRGAELVFVRWQERSPGKAFHARYVLTNLGGIRYDYGLDEGSPGQLTDVTLLEPALHLEALGDFCPEDLHEPSFDLVDRIVVRSIRT